MKNRWVILVAGIVMQTILGGIYAWSIFTHGLMDDYGLNKAQCGTIFGLCIAVFTLAMIFAGRLLSRRGPRRTAAISAVLFAAGYLIASVSGGSYGWLLLGIGVFSGAGIGFGYVCPLTVGMLWFPRRKGLITGIAVAGFGGGAIILSSVAAHVLGSGMDVMRFFMWLGMIAGALLLVSSLLLDMPEHTKSATVPPSASSELFTRPFLICLLGMFAGTFSGLLVIGHLTPIVEEAGLSVERAALAVSIFAAGNAAGRILWGFLFDRIGYRSIPASLGWFAAALLLISCTHHVGIILACAAGLGFGFGSNFVIYASSLSSYFDVASFPRLYPICFLGYGLAGITGPGIGGYLADTTGSYHTAIYLSIGLLAVAVWITGAGLKAFHTSPAPLKVQGVGRDDEC